MCRKHAPEAVATLVAALRDPKHKVAAATELLNRAFGRPATVITSPDGQSPTGLHLIAAQLVSATIFEAQVEPATQQHEPLLIDLSAPPPTE
jgi:hypothetical protein